MDLSPALPSGSEYSAVHLRTAAHQCKPLVTGQRKPPTLRAKHLLLLSDSQRRVVFGVEIYVYLTFEGGEPSHAGGGVAAGRTGPAAPTDLSSGAVPDIANSHVRRSVFVSKADTTGLGARFSAARVVEAFLSHLLSLDPRVYVAGAKWRAKTAPKSVSTSEFAVVNDLLSLSQRLRDDPSFYGCLASGNLAHSKKAAVATGGPKAPAANIASLSHEVALFTRSAHSYLFPNSEKNPRKHVADGDKLFQWWLAVLDRVLDSAWTCRADIPGADRAAVRKFLPTAAWETGSIYVDASSDASALDTIPLFPDDPKGRFLEHLIVEGRSKALTSAQFWAELGFRQEFRLGNVVGIIGCKKTGGSRSFTQVEGATVVSLGQYRKIMDLIKGEDYSVVEDIQNMWTVSLGELCKRLGVALEKKSFVGKMAADSGPAAKTVNVLAAKRAPVNNLTGLVKRKAK